MEKQDYYITKGTMILTEQGHMTVNSYESGVVCLTEFDSAFHAVGARHLSLEDIAGLLHERFGREFNVIWKEKFTRA